MRLFFRCTKGVPPCRSVDDTAGSIPRQIPLQSNSHRKLRAHKTASCLRQGEERLQEHTMPRRHDSFCVALWTYTCRHFCMVVFDRRVSQTNVACRSRLLSPGLSVGFCATMTRKTLGDRLCDALNGQMVDVPDRSDPLRNAGEAGTRSGLV